jgi:hypothetical protein
MTSSPQWPGGPGDYPDLERYFKAMSGTALVVIVCVVAALILVAILATLMLAPARLRRPFRDGYTRKQWAALREKRRAQAERRGQRR